MKNGRVEIPELQNRVTHYDVTTNQFTNLETSEKVKFSELLTRADLENKNILSY